MRESGATWHRHIPPQDERLSLPCLICLWISRTEAVERDRQTAPDAVVHCAAWTAVDAAEEEANQDLVRRINADGTRYIAQACSDCGSKMVYLSTDYVFDGTGTEPWKPDCKDYSPLNVYGQSKLEGELAVSETLEKYFIVRIAWVLASTARTLSDHA